MNKEEVQAVIIDIRQLTVADLIKVNKALKDNGMESIGVLVENPKPNPPFALNAIKIDEPIPFIVDEYKPPLYTHRTKYGGRVKNDKS